MLINSSRMCDLQQYKSSDPPWEPNDCGSMLFVTLLYCSSRCGLLCAAAVCDARACCGAMHASHSKTCCCCHCGVHGGSHVASNGWHREVPVPLPPLCVQDLGLKSFASILVQHCKHAFGFEMTTEGGEKFVFSGDTQKCANVVNAARGAALLVHEATFENHLRRDADYKKHSTISDAVAVRPSPLSVPYSATT